ncbi:hypothetical protein [Bradyrhizobium sp. ORS 86]|uniref:hypothetical protein n=1 Tax=Bradyrhizobium sp. ORS 86 TaxID=1685970 RepID=UPI00388EE672
MLEAKHAACGVFGYNLVAFPGWLRGDASPAWKTRRAGVPVASQVACRLSARLIGDRRVRRSGPDALGSAEYLMAVELHELQELPRRQSAACELVCARFHTFTASDAQLVGNITGGKKEENCKW